MIDDLRLVIFDYPIVNRQSSYYGLQCLRRLVVEIELL
jgi:hypothetical protein